MSVCLPPAPPDYLDDALRRRWAALAPLTVANGTLTAATADAFARYIIAEQQYIRSVQHTIDALHRGDAPDARIWAAVQDRFARQLAVTGRGFGLTPDAQLI